jgi:hypothetical protein
MSYRALFLFLFIAAAPHAAQAKTTSLESHQPIKAEVIDDNPSHFTIDVEEFENADADEEAPTFALYTSEEPPKTCGDFSDLDLKYEKPEEHKRMFDLTDHKDVLDALKKYQCVVVKNN